MSLATYVPHPTQISYDTLRRDEAKFIERTRFSTHVFETVLCPAVIPVMRAQSRHTLIHKPCQLEDRLRLVRYLIVLADGKYNMAVEMFNQSTSTVQRDCLFISKCVCVGLSHYMQPIELGSYEYFFLKGNFHLAFAPDALYIGDVTPIKIERPKEDQHIYYNGHRKCHVLNVLCIMDSKGRYRRVYGPYVGSIHDVRIWKNCEFCLNIDRYLARNDLLVYDKGLIKTDVNRDRLLLPLCSFTG